MKKDSYTKFRGNFKKNYNYFALTYSGNHLSLYLDRFIKDQMKMAQIIYGNNGAKMLQEFADKLSHQA